MDKSKNKKAETLKDHAESLDNVQHDATSKDSTQKDHNMKFFNYVYDLLPVGQSDPVSMTALSNILKVNPRSCRRIIFHMRKNDYLICSNERGYFKPKDNDELKEWYFRADASAKSTMKTTHHAKQILKQAGLL